MGIAQVNNVVQSGGQHNSTGPYFTLPMGTDLTNLIVLSAQVNSSTANQFLVMYRSGVQYQVTAAKTFVMFGMWAYGSSAGGFGLGTSTATFANDAAAVTSGVFYNGASGNTQFLSGNAVHAFFPYHFKFAATLYPFVQTTSGSVNFAFTIIGKEF